MNIVVNDPNASKQRSLARSIARSAPKQVSWRRFTAYKYISFFWETLFVNTHRSYETV